jgi:hypothetical protein
MAGKAGATRGISARLLKHFMEYPGQRITVEELSAECGGATHTQIGNSVSYLIRGGKLPGLKSVQNGHVWVYEPEGDDEPKWSLVHQNPAGKVRQAILEDTDGNLWVAKPVDI